MWNSPSLNRMSTVVHRNNVVERMLKRQNTVVPYSNNNSGVTRMLKRQNTVVPYSNNTNSKPRNNVIGHMLQRKPTVVMEMGGKRKTRRNKKVRKTRRSHKK